jgi:hypothetical protein
MDYCLKACTVDDACGVVDSTLYEVRSRRHCVAMAH